MSDPFPAYFAMDDSPDEAPKAFGESFYLWSTLARVLWLMDVIF